MAAKNNSLKQEAYYIKDTEQVVGKPRVTLRRWWNDGKFPKPHMLNGRLAWRASVVHEWLDQNLGAQS